MKVKTIVGLCLVISILLSGCGGGKFKPDTMSMNDIGIMKIDDENSKVYHGMIRSDAEKILGNGSKESFFVTYDFGIQILYRFNQENNEETVALIVMSRNSKKKYSTLRGAKIGDLKNDVIQLYGENHFIPGIDRERDFTYYYDLKTDKFLGRQFLSNNSSNREELYQQIGAEFLVNDDGYIGKILLYDIHAMRYLR